MSTTAPNPPAVPQLASPTAKPRRKRGRSVVIPFVDWKTYTRVLKAFGDRPRLRLTYDRGDLEIMVPSDEHEIDATFLARLVVILTEELRLPIRTGGSTTLKRKRMKKGLEPDKCFWIANASKVAGVKLDLNIHPPPDLAIEVDVTRSSLDRFRIYRTLGVGELWHLAGDALEFHVLGADKKYAQVSTSPTFPGITPADLMTFVKQARGVADQNMTAAAFRAWLQQRIATAAPSPSPTPATSPPAPPPKP
jgi:Uma2 family endonuclease